MVTKEGSVGFMPDEWKARIRELADQYVEDDQENTAHNLVSDIEKLVDQCVTEAVIALMAELPDPLVTMQDMVTRLEEERGQVKTTRTATH